MSTNYVALVLERGRERIKDMTVWIQDSYARDAEGQELADGWDESAVAFCILGACQHEALAVTNEFGEADDFGFEAEWVLFDEAESLLDWCAQEFVGAKDASVSVAAINDGERGIEIEHDSDPGELAEQAHENVMKVADCAIAKAKEAVKTS